MPKVTLKPEYRPKGRARAAKEKELEPTPRTRSRIRPRPDRRLTVAPAHAGLPSACGDTSMPLIVEDGSGLANADSYVSVADCQAYAADHGLAFAGEAAALAALRNATLYLDGEYTYCGERATDIQALEWPHGRHRRAARGRERLLRTGGACAGRARCGRTSAAPRWAPLSRRPSARSRRSTPTPPARATTARRAMRA